MKRILIVGCCGAGKSTIARKLKACLGLPVIHLDQHYHLPNWEEPSTEVWRNRVSQLVNGERWIMDGNYGGSLDIRLPVADTVIFMDYPTSTCLWRVLTRTWKYRGTVRPDMPAGCRERFDLNFLHYVATFNIVRRPILLKQIEAFHGRTVLLKSDEAVADFLREIESA